MKIEITTLNATVDSRWAEDVGEAVPHVVLRWGDTDVTAWRLSTEEANLLTSPWNENDRELEGYVAKRLAALFAA